MGLFQQASRARDAIVALALTTAIVAILLSASASSAPQAGLRTYVSHDYGYSIALPAGWQRAGARLVPKLLDPREILSVGTFPMPVGGGGNCGREPAAAIRRMHAGDALLSIQERSASHRTKAFTRLQDLPHLVFLRSPLNGSGVVGVGVATPTFSDHGRAFEALIYVKGRLTRPLREQIDSILSSLRFKAGR